MNPFLIGAIVFAGVSILQCMMKGSENETDKIHENSVHNGRDHSSGELDATGERDRETVKDIKNDEVSSNDERGIESGGSGGVVSDGNPDGTSNSEHCETVNGKDKTDADESEK